MGHVLAGQFAEALAAVPVVTAYGRRSATGLVAMGLPWKATGGLFGAGWARPDALGRSLIAVVPAKFSLFSRE